MQEPVPGFNIYLSVTHTYDARSARFVSSMGKELIDVKPGTGSCP